MMRSGTALLNNQRGVTYMVVLVMVVVLGLAAAVTGSSWQTVVQRAKEKELLFRGDQYRQAIGSYYRHAHGGAPSVYPNSLEDLLRDPRSVQTVRHIRKLYPDPMTGGEWEVVRQGGNVEGATGGSGRIIGVRSRSDLEPFKKNGFSKANKDFADAGSYSEWEFIFRPQASTPANSPAQTASPAPAAPSGASGNP